MDFVRLVDEDQISEFALLYPTKLRKKKRITKIFPREHLLRARDWLPLRWLIVSLKMGYRIVKYIVMTLALVVSGALCAQTPAERVATVRAQCEGANAERISARTTTEIGVPSEQREFACRYLQRRFGFVLENVDTSAVTSERYIPVLLLETESEIFLRHSPALAYEQISGAHIAGIKEDYSVSQIADQLPLAVDLFSDRILVLGRELIGPLDTAQYRYEFVGQGATTRIAFVPREGEGFVGEMEIDATGALRNLSAQYQIVSFAVGKRTITILGRCEVAYGEPQVIAEIPANIERLARRRRVRNYTLEGDAAKWRASNPLNERETGNCRDDRLGYPNAIGARYLLDCNCDCIALLRAWSDQLGAIRSNNVVQPNGGCPLCIRTTYDGPFQSSSAIDRLCGLRSQRCRIEGWWCS